MEKAREFQENIYFCFIDYTKAFDCVDHNQLWKILKEMSLACVSPLGPRHTWGSSVLSFQGCLVRAVAYMCLC